MTIRKSTDADLVEIGRWLRAECERDGEGFWMNWNVLEDAHAKGRLFVLPDDATDLPIGFIANGSHGPDILSVRTDRRKEGAGRRLAQHMVQLFTDQDEISVIELQCSPPTSVPFWLKMGFTHYRSQGLDRAYRVVEKPWPMNPSAPVVDVRIAFYPEAARRRADVEPLMVATPKAIWEAENSVGLGERVVFFKGNRSDASDIVVSLVVDGVELYRDKAKYPEAEKFGVIADSYAYYLDEVVVTEEEITSGRAATA